MNTGALTPGCDAARPPLAVDPGPTAWLRLGRYERRRQRLLAARAQGHHILDVGYAAMPNPHLPASNRRVTGIDRVAPSAPDDYDQHLVGDIFSLRPLSGQQRYDTIIAGEFIEHLENPYALVRELAGSLNPGGRLILSTPNPLSFPVLLCEWLRSRRYFFDPEHTYYFSPRWMTRLLERAGYGVIEVAAVGLWPYGLPCPVGFSYQVIYVAARC